MKRRKVKFEGKYAQVIHTKTNLDLSCWRALKARPNWGVVQAGVRVPVMGKDDQGIAYVVRYATVFKTAFAGDTAHCRNYWKENALGEEKTG